MSAQFSPKVHQDGDLSMLEDPEDNPNRSSLPCNTSQQPHSESHDNSLVAGGSFRGGVAASECLKRAMTPVIGSFSQKELDEPLSTTGLGGIRLDNLMGSPRGSTHTPIRAQKSMHEVLPSAAQGIRQKNSPHDSMFSRQFSTMEEVQSVASSSFSTISTRNQIDKCKDVLLKALNLKKLGCLKDYNDLISQQPFRKANCNERVLRLWVKAFLEMMPTIVKEFGDNELVELLLYKLPWLCHGLKQGLKVSASGAISVRRSSQLGSASQSRWHEQASQRSQADCGASGTFQSQSELNSSQGGGRSGAPQINLKAGADLAQSQTCQEGAAQSSSSPWAFGPSYVHGAHFHLFSKLCLSVIPLQVQQAHRLLRHIFSHLGIFMCENPRCVGNPKAKEMSSLQPPTIASCFSDRLEQICATNHHPQSTSGPNDFVSVVKTLFKPHQSTQKSLEALSHEVRHILRREGAALFEEGSTQTEPVLISNDNAKKFLRALLSYHPEKKVDEATEYSVALKNGQPCLLVNGDPTSFQKCLVALQREFLEQMQKFSKAFFQQANIKAMCQLVVQIGLQYPFTQKEILKLLLASFPHQNASLDSLIIYQRLANEIVDGILKRVCKVARSCNASSQSRYFSQAGSQSAAAGNVSQKFNKQGPLRQALELEKAILMHSIEKIAALDAADLKRKPRKGSTYPVREGYGTMQTAEDYSEELSKRFLTDKELKNSLMLLELFAYLRKRIVYFNRYESELLGKEQGCNILTDCFQEVFEERIYSQNRSKLLQFIPLFIIGHASQGVQSAANPKALLSREASNACNTFGQLVLSFLVRIAFPSETHSLNAKDSSATSNDRQMKALNYLGSLLSQKMVKLPAKLVHQCLRLLMSFQERRQKRWSQQGESNELFEGLAAAVAAGNSQQGMNGNTSSHKLFNHCLYQNLAMIFAKEHQMIKTIDPDLFQKLSKQLFHRKHGSLEYASPHILESLLQSTKQVDENGELVDVSDSKQMYHIKRKVQQVVEQQQQAVKSTKMAVYKMIPRWMPYSIPLYIEPIRRVFDRLGNAEVDLTPQYQSRNTALDKKSLASSAQDQLQDVCDSLANSGANLSLQPEQSQQNQEDAVSNGNILNEPVSPRDYKLQHRKSIHEYFGANPEEKQPHQLQALPSKQSSSATDENKAANLSAEKGAASTTGLVSEAFRKRNKYTQDQMMRVNPQLRVASYSAATSAQTPSKQALSSAIASSSIDDEVMSSGPQSDQMTVSSPISQEHTLLSVEGGGNISAERQQKALRKAINSEVEKQRKRLTSTLQEANRLHEQNNNNNRQNPKKSQSSNDANKKFSQSIQHQQRQRMEAAATAGKSGQFAPFRPPKSKRPKRH